MTGRRRAALALALLVALPLAACGRRGPPVAPETRLPAAVQDLTVNILGEGVTLIDDCYNSNPAARESEHASPNLSPFARRSRAAGRRPT